MGIFDKLFKANPDPIPSKTYPQHKEEWDFYFSNIDDKIGSIYLDLGLAKVAPLVDKSNLIWVSIKMNEPREDGLSSSSEYDKLKDLEDRLCDFIQAKHDAMYAGRVTSNGKRDFFFYSGYDSVLLEKTISETMAAFPVYEYDFVVQEDVKWSNYLDFLYPLPSQFQSIQNRRVLDTLEKNGDTLTKERNVDHWIFFKSEIDRNDFLTIIKDEGFNIRNSDYDSERGETPFLLQISRIDKVDYNSVDDYVLYLWKIANECNGDYDGWETSVEKD